MSLIPTLKIRLCDTVLCRSASTIVWPGVQFFCHAENTQEGNLCRKHSGVVSAWSAFDVWGGCFLHERSVFGVWGGCFLHERSAFDVWGGCFLHEGSVFWHVRGVFSACEECFYRVRGVFSAWRECFLFFCFFYACEKHSECFTSALGSPLGEIRNTK